MKYNERSFGLLLWLALFIMFILLPSAYPLSLVQLAQGMTNLKKQRVGNKMPFISVCITSERLGWLGNWKTLGCYTSLTHSSQLTALQLHGSSAVQLFSSWWRWRDGSSCWFACNPFGYVLPRPSLSRHSNMTNSAQNVKQREEKRKRETKKNKNKMWTANCICNWGKWTFWSCRQIHKCLLHSEIC